MKTKTRNKVTVVVESPSDPNITITLPASVARDVIEALGPTASVGASYDFYIALDQALQTR